MKIAVAGATGLVGAQLTALAREEGHEVVALARSTGFDLLRPEGDRLREALAGVEVVVDVTSSAGVEDAEPFFTAVARNLGHAAAAAGVIRTVVLSIVGVDRSPDFDYYVAKLAHERATREHAPGPVVLRATQFHEFAGQMLAWNTQDGVVRVMDVPSQPVATGEVARVLLDLATGALSGDQDLAGPRAERLVDQVRALVDRSGSGVTVEPAPAAASMAGGSMLPGPGPPPPPHDPIGGRRPGAARRRGRGWTSSRGSPRRASGPSGGAPIFWRSRREPGPRPTGTPGTRPRST